MAGGFEGRRSELQGTGRKTSAPFDGSAKQEPGIGELVATDWRRLAMVVLSALIGAASLALVGPVAAAPINDVEPWGLQQIAMPTAETLQGVGDGGSISMTRDGSSIGLTRQSYPYDRPDRYFVLEQTPPGHTTPFLEELDAPGKPTMMDGLSQLSADGRNFVATFKWDFDLSTCNPGPQTNYRNQQVLRWRRATAEGPFGAPELVSGEASAAADPCLGEPYPNNDLSSEPLMGVGGNGFSSWPSVDEDGQWVAYVSEARNLTFGTPPSTTGRAALYVQKDGSPSHMVTPVGLDGDVTEAVISADGQHILFASSATNLVAGVPAGKSQVYLATRTGGEFDDPFTFELVSKNDAGTPSNAPATAGGRFGSSGLTINEDATRVAYTSLATNLEPAVSTAGAPVLVVGDLATATTRVVVADEPTLTARSIGDEPGRPALSLDGTGLTIMSATKPAGGGARTAKRLLVFDADAQFTANRRDSIRVSRPYQDGTNRGGFVAIGPDPNIGSDETAPFLIAFASMAGPLPRFDDDEPAVYFASTRGIGDDRTRGWHGDPVDISLGNFRQETTDLAAPAGQWNADLTRSYNSYGDSTGIFGDGWVTQLDAHITPDLAEHQVDLLEPNGQHVLFLEDDTGAWITAQGSRLTLAEGTSAGSWTVTEPSGASRTFDDTGHLVATESTTGATTAISWDGASPTTLETSAGYSVTFTDDVTLNRYGTEPGPDGLVDKVITSDGREVTYGYQLGGPDQPVLASASSPHAIGQPASTFGQITYEIKGSLITKISETVDAGRSHVLVENTYDNWGRVIAQVLDQGDVVTYAYGQRPDPILGTAKDPAFTTVTNTASGDVTIYEYDASGALVSTTDALGQSSVKSWAGEQPAATTSRSGVDTEYAYDAAGRVITVTSTAGSSVRTTASYAYVTADSSPAARTDDRVASSTDAAGVTTTYTYDGDAREPATVSVPCDPDTIDSASSCPASGLATTVYEYWVGDLAGLVKSVTDPDGVVTSYTYHDDRTVATTTIDDGTPRVTAVDRFTPTDPAWPFTDPAAVTAERVTAPGGAISWQAFDAAGRVLEARDPLYDGAGHGATRYAYRLDGSLASVTDPTGAVSTSDVRRPGDLGWAEASNIAEVSISTDPDGVSTIAKVDRSGDTVIEQIGDLANPASLATTTNTYGPLGRLLSTVDPAGVRTSFDHDVEGRVVGETIGNDPDSALHTTSTTYTAFGEVASVSTPMGNDPDGTPVTRRTDYVYDGAGRKVAQLDGAGGPGAEQLLTGYVHDNAGRLSRTIEHRHAYVDTANPTVLHVEDKVTDTRFTVAGRTAEQVMPPVDAVTFDWASPDSAKAITRYGYDPAGRQTTVTDPGGLVTTTTYDADGRRASVTSPAGREVQWRYDAAGRVVETITPSGLTGPGAPATVSTKQGYDAAGRAVTATDAHAPVVGVTDPSTRTTEYSPGGRVTKVTDALGHAVTYGYDSRGNRLSRTAKDDAGLDRVTSWTYDLAGRVVTATVPPPRAGATSKTTTYAYDAEFGRSMTVTNPVGEVETRSYYADGTLMGQAFTPTTSGKGVTRTFWVNGRGWQTKARAIQGAAAGRTNSYTFDRAGQRTSTTTFTGNTVVYGWDLTGHQSALGYPDGAIASYLHDPSGRMTEVSVTSAGITAPFASYTYDGDGIETSEVLHAAGGASRSEVLDAAGRTTSYTQTTQRPGGAFDTYSAALTYRPDGRTATETINSDPTTTYGYDAAGQLTSASSTAATETWTYGTRGNRLSAASGGVNTTYVTNPNGSVAKTTAGSAVTTFTYDDAGRRGLTQTKVAGVATRTNSLTYNSAGQVTNSQRTATGLPTGVEIRAYDADGLMVFGDINADGLPQRTYNYIWDTTRAVPQVIDIKAQGATWLRSTWGNRRLAYKQGSAAAKHFEYDAHGSTIRTDDTNTTLEDGPPGYRAFGAPTATTDYLRTGYRAELTNGDYTYLRNRTYDPSVGQFTTQDPLDGQDGTPTIANPYHYTDNDPINRHDPLGLRPIEDTPFACVLTYAAETSYFGRGLDDAASDLTAFLSEPRECVRRLEKLNDCDRFGGTAWNWEKGYGTWACGTWEKSCAGAHWSLVCNHQAGLYKASYGLLGAAIAAFGYGTGNAYLVGCGTGAAGGALFGNGQDVQEDALGGCISGAGAASGHWWAGCIAGGVGQTLVAESGGVKPGVVACISGAIAAGVGSPGAPGTRAALITVSPAAEVGIQCVSNAIAGNQTDSTDFHSAWAVFYGCAAGVLGARTDK